MADCAADDGRHRGGCKGRRKPAWGLMHHLDQGSQYASRPFQDQLTQYGMICSMRRKANCWDNAPTESFFNSLKNERVHNSRYTTRLAAEADVFEYSEVFYNRKRLHSTLGHTSPIQFMEHWMRGQYGIDSMNRLSWKTKNRGNLT